MEYTNISKYISSTTTNAILSSEDNIIRKGIPIIRRVARYSFLRKQY